MRPKPTFTSRPPAGKHRRRAAKAIQTALHVGPARAHNLVDGAEPGPWQHAAVTAIIDCYRRADEPANALAVAAVHRGLYPAARIFDVDTDGLRTVRADDAIITACPADWSQLMIEDDGGWWGADSHLHPAEHDPLRIADRLTHAADPDHGCPLGPDEARLVAEAHGLGIRTGSDVACPLCLPALTGEGGNLHAYEQAHARHLTGTR